MANQKKKATPISATPVLSQADRERMWSLTPQQRLRECERLRQLKYGYGNGKPHPKREKIFRIMNMNDPDPDGD